MLFVCDASLSSGASHRRAQQRQRHVAKADSSAAETSRPPTPDLTLRAIQWAAHSHRFLLARA